MDRIISVISSGEYRFFQEILTLIKKQYGEKEVWIFGAGTMGMQFYYVARKMGVTIAGFYDNDSKKHGKTIEGVVIYPPNLNYDNIRLIVVAMERSEEVGKQLSTAGLHPNRDYLLLYNICEKKCQEMFCEIKGKKTFLLGDCGITSVSLDDLEKDSIEDLLMKDSEILSFAVNGLYMRQYYELIKASISMGIEYGRILMAVDMSFFENHVHTFSKNQHVALFEKIDRDIPLSDGFIEILRNRENVGGWLDLSSPDREDGLSDEKIRMEMIRHARFSYLYRIDEESESMRWLDSTMDLCREYGISFTLVILPVNYELLEKLLGENFKEGYARNVTTIKQHFEQPFNVLDLSFLLSEEEFVSIRSVQEVMKSKGRKYVADMICKEALSVFGRDSR